MSGPRILIVEDSVTMRQLLCFAIKRVGEVEIIEAGNGLEGLKVLKTEQDIDIVLVDINMPVMDGFKLIGHIRHDLKMESLPIIIITTESKPETLEKARSLGVNHYITKPIRQSDVVEKVRGLLKKT